MPSPLGHFTVAYLIYKSKKTLSLPALIVGSVISDSDLLLDYLTGGRLGRELLHSFIGGGIFGTVASSLLTVLFYPLIVSALFSIRREDARQACKLSKTLVVSSFIGCLSHVLVDSTCHNYNPLLYPFTRQSIDILLLPYDWGLLYIVVEILLFAILLTVLVVDFSKKGFQGFWKRILIGSD